MKNFISILCGILLFCLICSVPAACKDNEPQKTNGKIISVAHCCTVFLFEVGGQQFLVTKEGYLLQINRGDSND